MVQSSAVKMAEAGVSAHRGQLVKAGEQLIQRHDQLLGCALRRKAGEALNVCKQYAARELMVVIGESEGEGNKTDREKKTKETQNESSQIKT